MFVSKYKFIDFKKFVMKKLADHEIKYEKTHKWANETEARLYELEKIVKNQPLIKKYQKTLDIFLKNAKND